MLIPSFTRLGYKSSGSFTISKVEGVNTPTKLAIAPTYHLHCNYSSIIDDIRYRLTCFAENLENKDGVVTGSSGMLSITPLN